ncbi:MAG: RNA 2',3'-cyclic phosphodiesterase [Bacilli bacterium]|nr:RNA 2',3'-cyclic phosphodiesterase [Bacilli bacterium]MBN2697013.1 RNA 2',3'-cyclic phosphodiesterase [Bacilli bacterium]
MRVFFAILPDAKTKAKLHEMGRKMRNLAKSGNFTSADNFHVTLVFVGDVSESTVDKLKHIVDEIHYSTFVVKTRNLGFFSNRGSKDILVWHVERSQELADLKDSLLAKIKRLGFQLEDRDFRPHFTLGRKVDYDPAIIDRDAFYHVPIVFMRCERLSLMESKRINGKLVYKEIYGKDFEVISERKL